MEWLWLVMAGLMEVGWPIGLKVAQTPGKRLVGVGIAVVCMAASGCFLWLAQKCIPMGTAYAVWTGIGTVGTFAVGILFFGDAATIFRMLSALLIVVGMVGLKLAS